MLFCFVFYLSKEEKKISKLACVYVCMCVYLLDSSGRESCQKPTPASIFLVPGEDFINIWEVAWGGGG